MVVGRGSPNTTQVRRTVSFSLTMVLDGAITMSTSSVVCVYERERKRERRERERERREGERERGGCGSGYSTTHFNCVWCPWSHV